MNEPNPESIGAPPAPAFKDRSIGLTVFGILTILMGCLVALMTFVMVIGLAMAANNPNVAPTPGSYVALVALLYGALAVGLIWLGIGSIKARRWARALILIFSWGWLVVGICMVIFMGVFMPQQMANMPATPGQPAMPPGTIAVMTVFMVLFFSVFFIVLPAIWIFFYASRHTQATVELRDPVTRWTDACPLPVLALSLWLLFGVPFLLLMPILGHGVMPFFGTFLSGVPGTFLCLALAALWSFCAWGLYKMDVRAWWITFLAMLLFGVSGIVTYAHVDPLEMYRQMGYSQAQIDQLKQTGFLTGNRMNWMMLLFMAPFLGYVVYVKKYLKGAKVAEA